MAENIAKILIIAQNPALVCPLLVFAKQEDSTFCTFLLDHKK